MRLRPSLDIFLFGLQLQRIKPDNLAGLQALRSACTYFIRFSRFLAALGFVFTYFIDPGLKATEEFINL